MVYRGQGILKGAFQIRAFREDAVHGVLELISNNIITTWASKARHHAGFLASF
jgi:hypothetical protein